MTVQSGTRLGPYLLTARIGAGGMGEVWRARDERLDRDIAVKVLPAEFARDARFRLRFEREAKTISQLNHPHICSIYDVGEGYLAMELLEGGTLRDALRNGPLPPRKATEYAIQIANALAAAHARGITHRDLKPENVFITRGGGVKLLDFGLAKVDSHESDGDSKTVERVTDPGTVMGTAGYMSPEQVRGETVDPRTDIFALGTILYEMLSGRRAFDGPSSADAVSAILRQDPPEISGSGVAVSAALERIVRRCIEKSREERFQSAHDLAFALEAISGSSDAIREASPRRTRWRGWWVAGAVAAALLLAFVGAKTIGAFASGRSSDVKFVPVTFRNGRVTSAAFAGDGESVVYSAAWNGAPLELYSTRIGESTSRLLGQRDARVAAISRSGELAIIVENDPSSFADIRGGRSTLATMSLSGGAPRPLLEGVSWADWAPDGTLAALVEHDGLQSVEYPLGHPLVRKILAREIRVSPDGDRVAVFERDAGSNNAGSIVTFDRKGERRLLSGGWDNIKGIAWRADGKEIWFTAAMRGSTRALWAVDLRGKLRRLISVPGMLTLADVGRDNRVLVQHLRSRSSMMVLQRGTTEERDVSWLDFSLIADISSDGRTILFTEGAEGGGQKGAAYLWDLSKPEPVRLGEGVGMALSPDVKSAIVIDPAQPEQITILPTGPGLPRQMKLPFKVRWATFLPGGNAALVAGMENGQPQRVFRLDLRSGASHPLTPPNTWLCVTSPDGTEFVTKDGATGRAFLYSLAGGAPRPVPGVAASTSRDFPLQWSADGTSLFVQATSDMQRETSIDLVDVRSGARRPWKRIVASDPASFYGFEPDIRITRDGAAYAYSTPRILTDLYVIEGLR